MLIVPAHLPDRTIVTAKCLVNNPCRLKQFTYIKFFPCKGPVLRVISIISFNPGNSTVTKVLPLLLEG